MDASDFFSWCDKLDLSDEISRRSFVSRQYYGLFHTIKAAFPEMPEYSDVGIHKAVSEYLEKGYSGDKFERKDLKKLSYMFRQAKQFRVSADYMISDFFDMTNCEAAKQSISNCRSHLSKIIQ